ncbi:MAG: TonB family protein [Bryobacteraceae bacterium]|nr:TonB family protein [Bryobacteraceae bacterium]MDW8379190.1 TonB family protein [Bryobacterales bacterium]
MSYAELMDRGEPLHKPLAASIALHLFVTGVILGWTWYHERRKATPFGDEIGIPGAVTIQPTNGIPMMSRGPRNPVANDTESQVPAPSKPEPRRRSQEDPDAIAIGRKDLKKRSQAERRETAMKRFREEEQPSNQLASTTGARASSSLFVPLSSGGGGVGVGSGNPFGAQFGWYARLISERISQKWRTQDIDPRLQEAPPAVISFEILRDGAVRNATLIQSSGNYLVDATARRAIQEASPLPPLPQGFAGNTATVEIRFHFRR